MDKNNQRSALKSGHGILGNYGFTLIEIMVAASIVTVIAMVAISQFSLSSRSKKSLISRAIINGLSSRVLIEMSDENTCSLATNLGQKSISTTYTSIGPTLTALHDSTGNEILKIDGQYLRDFPAAVPNITATGANLDLVRVQDIMIKQKSAAEPTEAVLLLKFTKNESLVNTLFQGTEQMEIPLHVIVSSGLIQSCFSDNYLAIVTAVKMACDLSSADATSPDSFAQYIQPQYDQPDNRYGQCKRQLTTTITDAGTVTDYGQKFIKRVEVAANNLKFTTPDYFKNAPANFAATGDKTLYIDGLTASGTLGNFSQTRAFPTCSQGNILLRTSGGTWKCVDINCASEGTPTLNALSGFDSAGTPVCGPVHNATPCTGVCRAYDVYGQCTQCDTAGFTAVTCQPNQAIHHFDSTGNAVCQDFIQSAYDGTTSSNRVAYTDASGNVVPKAACAALMCGGAYSPSGKTKTDCTSAGGTYHLESINNTMICEFGGGACPGGWSQCGTYGTSGTTKSCTNTYTGNLCTTKSPISGTNTVTALAWSSTGANTSTQTCYHWVAPTGNPYCNATTEVISTTTLSRGCY